MELKLILISLVFIFAFGISCNNSQNNNTEKMDLKDSTHTTVANLHQDSVTFMVNNKNYIGFVVYDQNMIGKRPAIFSST